MKQKLNNLQKIKEEIKELEEKIEEIESHIDIQTDSVKGSSPEHPYIYHTISIHGIVDREAAKRLTRAKISLGVQKAKLKRMIIELEDLLQGHPERKIITMKHLDEKTWKEIAKKLNMGESAVRMRAKRFLERG